MSEGPGFLSLLIGTFNSRFSVSSYNIATADMMVGSGAHVQFVARGAFVCPIMMFTNRRRFALRLTLSCAYHIRCTSGLPGNRLLGHVAGPGAARNCRVEG